MHLPLPDNGSLAVTNAARKKGNSTTEIFRNSLRLPSQKLDHLVNLNGKSTI